jgi:hypothetical protein
VGPVLRQITHFEAVPNDVSKPSAAADASQLAISGVVESASTVLVADSVSVDVSHFKDVRFFGNMCIALHSVSKLPMN